MSGSDRDGICSRPKIVSGLGARARSPIGTAGTQRRAERTASAWESRERVAVRDDLTNAECPPDGVVVRVRACGICGGDLKRNRE